MNIIQAFQEAEKGKLITNNFLKSINHFLKYVSDGVFYEYNLIEGKPNYRYEVRKFSTAEIISTDWEIIDIGDCFNQSVCHER